MVDREPTQIGCVFRRGYACAPEFSIRDQPLFARARRMPEVQATSPCTAPKRRIELPTGCRARQPENGGHVDIERGHVPEWPLEIDDGDDLTTPARKNRKQRRTRPAKSQILRQFAMRRREHEGAVGIRALVFPAGFGRFELRLDVPSLDVPSLASSRVRWTRCRDARAISSLGQNSAFQSPGQCARYFDVEFGKRFHVPRADDADVAGCTHLFGPPAEIARAIRQHVRAELGLPISVGVARTKHLAKIASQGQARRARGC
jgi:impB/mucB/samB family